MQKSGLAIVASGALIVIGLILLVVGNQIILEGVSQGNGKVNANQELTIIGYFDNQETQTGVLAVQVMEFRENTFSARLFDPLGVEITSETIDKESFQKSFDIFETGEYKLVVESNNIEEAQIFGAIGPLPDSGKESLGFISVYVLIVGMLGMVGIGIYSIKNRKRSI